MRPAAKLGADQSTVTITVPLRVRRKGGRKHVITPEGAPAWASRMKHVDGTLVKALGRAFRWRRLMEDGVYVSCEEVAAAEKINVSYVSRVLRLTLLAPEIVEAILDGRHDELRIATLLRPFPTCWAEQRLLFRR